MRKTVIAGMAAALGVSTAVAAGAFAGGAGAAHLWLRPTTTSDSHQCDQATSNGNAGSGFANINAPGKPGEAKFFNGEVSLKNAAPGAYTVYVANAGDDGSCKLEGPIVTNGQGNGNLHLTDPDLKNGDFYVVIRDAGNHEVFATTDATIL